MVNFVASVADNAILYISSLAELAIAVCLIKNKLHKKYFPLLFFHLARIANSVVLRCLYLKQMSHLYALWYWSSTHLFYAVQFWILLAIFMALFKWVRSHSVLALATTFMLTVSTSVGTILAFWAPNSFRTQAKGFLLVSDRACMFSWCLLFILITIGSQVAGIRWTKAEASICASFGAISLSQLLWVEVVSRFPQVWATTATINNCVYMLSVVFLSIALFHLPAKVDISVPELENALLMQEEAIEARR